MQDWDNKEKWNNWFAQECEKIHKELDQLSIDIKIANQKYNEMPLLKRKYHDVACFVVVPIYRPLYRLKCRIKRWLNARQSPYTCVDMYK